MSENTAPEAHGVDAAELEADGERYRFLSLPLLHRTAAIALTSAERDVAAHLVAGRTNIEIARCRGTSARTIANQLRAIYQKLGVGSRYELIELLVSGTVPAGHRGSLASQGAR